MVSHGLYCSLEDCKAQAVANTSLFRCPKDPIRCRQWKESLGFVGNHKFAKLTAAESYSRIRICSAHFSPESFSFSGKRLLKTAVPTILYSKVQDYNKVGYEISGLSNNIQAPILKLELPVEVDIKEEILSPSVINDTTIATHEEQQTSVPTHSGFNENVLEGPISGITAGYEEGLQSCQRDLSKSIQSVFYPEYVNDASISSFTIKEEESLQSETSSQSEFYPEFVETSINGMAIKPEENSQSSQSGFHPASEKASTSDITEPEDRRRLDIVLSLLETPFSRRSEAEKQQILNNRPTPKLTAIFNEKRKGGERLRTFQSSWYNNYQWLCGSSYKESLYCWPCILLGNAKNSWCSNDGFRDLKNFSRGTKTHEGSKEHIKNYLALRRLQKSSSTIEDALRENASLNKILYNENVRKNRLLIGYLIDVTITLGKQELANETVESSNPGNFEEIFTCLIKRNQELTEHCKKFSSIFTGQFEMIQNDLIFCINEYLTNFIKTEIIDKECFFFGVIVDDTTTDITEHSQCSITLRYVKNGCLHERFLGFFDVSENRTAAVLYELLVTVLEPYNFKEKLVAQCYDGASIMSSELNGLQAKIKSSAPLALFTNCSAHRVNLVLQQSANQIDKSRIFFSTLLSISTYFHQSQKRAFLLDKIIGTGTPRSVDTRWYTRSKIVSLVANEWDNLILVFETIIKDKTSGSASINAAKGFLYHFQDFEFAILTKIYYEIFTCTDLLSQILQTKHLDVDYCSKQIKIASQRISELRNEEKFKNVFDHAKNVTGLPSKRGKSCDESEIFSSYKILYYEIIDCISLQLYTRFWNLQDLNFLALVDSSKFPEYANKFPEKLFECVLQLYPNIFEMDRLKNELNVLYRDEQFRNLEVQKTVEILYKEFKMVFSETYKLFCLVLTIPAKSISAETNFSCLKRIKTYLRNTMTKDLNNLSVMAIEKELLQSLSAEPQFYEDIINKFANLKDPRIEDLFYKK